MKAVILAGGQGTRLSEESVARPKPMIEIGGRPILWHILKIYSQHRKLDTADHVLFRQVKLGELVERSSLAN